MEKYLDKLPGGAVRWMGYLEQISNISFALGLFIELTIVILEKSKYIIQYEGWWFRITFGLFGLSLITCRRGKKQWLWLAVFGVIGLISYQATGRNEILRWIVFIWACHGKDMKKVLKLTFWYTTAGCALIILLSVFGIYGETVTEGFRNKEAWQQGITEIRYSLGMGHPNSLHCMMLAITWLGVYCYHEKIKWYGYFLIGTGHVLVYLLTVSRTGLLMSMGSVVIFLILHVFKKIQGKKWPYILGMILIVSLVLFSVFMAKYSVFHPFLLKLDRILSERITCLYYDTVNHEGMLPTWSLWSVERNNYYFDLGIIRFFYWYGIIPGILYFLAQCRLLWCGYKHKDHMMLAVVALISIYTLFEAHYVSDYMGRNYIFFFFGMYLTDMVGEK